MTIQEVIKSGKPFKRKRFVSWVCVYGNKLAFELSMLTFTPSVLDILADDWEVKQ